LLANVGQVRKAIVIQPDLVLPLEMSQLHINDGKFYFLDLVCIRNIFKKW